MNSSSAGREAAGKDQAGKDQAAGGSLLRLAPEQVAALFPFHIVFDRELRVLEVGPSLRKVLPELEPGCSFTERFVLESPLIGLHYEEILASVKSIFLVTSQTRGLRLRGQMLPLPGQEAIAFLCSPWLPEPGQFRSTGLTFEDFAVHDSMPEFVTVVQAQKFGIDDLRKLTERLRQQREAVKESNLKLVEQSAEFRKLALIAARTDNGVIITDAAGCVEWVNEAFARITGYTFEEVKGKRPGSLLQGPESDTDTIEYIRRQLHNGEGFQCEILNYRKDGSTYTVSIEVQPIRNDAGVITNYMAIEIDISARKEEEFRKDLAYSVSTILAEATETTKALHKILQTIVEALGYRFSAVWRLDADGKKLSPHTIWSITELRDSHFEHATRSLSLWRGVGLPGVTWETNAPSWIPDLAVSPNFVRRRAAQMDGLRSGFAVPIRVGGQACGVMEFYGAALKPPDDELLRTLTALGNQIGQFMERQDAQQERARLVSLLHSTLESTNDGILVVDLQRRFVTWNHRFMELWHLENEMMPNMDHRAVLEGAAQQATDPAEFVKRVMWWYEHPEEAGTDLIHFKDGRVLERTTQPHRIPGGVIGRVWSYRDVTNRWQAEQQLRETEERYRVISSTASDGIVSVNRLNRILFANEAAERIFGYGPGELIGRVLADLMAPSFRKLNPRGLFRVVRSTSSGASPKATEVMGVRQDGSEFPIEVTFGKAHIRGERVLTGVMRDITERRRSEESQRRATLEIEAANRAKSDFLASISHEIRTPLNSIAGLTELLRDTRLDPDQQDMVNTVWAGSESLLHLINDLLDISKIEAGQVDIASEPFDPVHVCERALEIVKTRAQRKRLALVCIVTPPAPPRLQGDPNRIGQILVNLLTNGVKFAEQGSVSLQFGWSVSETGTTALEFSVRDTGIGIRDEDRARVFEKFFRVDTRVGRQAGGTGLGLSISRLLAEIMGGTLTLQTTEAAGSCFALRLELPVAGPSAHAVTSAGSETALLLASGERLGLLCDTWKSTGLQVLPFESLRAATAHLDDEGPCSLVLLATPTSWDAEELKQFFRTLALRGRIRCIRMREPKGEALPEWTFQGAVETLDFPLTPSRMEHALERVLRGSDAAVSPTDSARPAAPVEAVTPARILLVEDNADSAAYAVRVFRKAGHYVAVAASIAETLEAIRRERFDVVFMDLMLPDGSGFEATKAIREYEQEEQLPRVPVVALTAHALQGYREQAYSAEMDDYLTKPVRQEALLSTVKKWANPKARGERVEAGTGGEVAAEAPALVRVDEDLADLVPSYLERILTDLERIGGLAAGGNLDEIRKLGHNMKGSGTAYGFSEITRLGAAIETAAKEANAAAAAGCAKSLLGYLRQVRWEAGE